MWRFMLSLAVAQEPEWGGICCSTGFILTRSESRNNPSQTQLCVGTYTKDEGMDNRAILFFIPILCAIILSCLISFLSDELFTIYSPTLLATGLLLGISFYNSSEAKQWHACEHKSAVLLRYKKEISAQNLKTAPKTLIFCGSAITALALQLVVGIITLQFTNNWLVFWWIISSSASLIYLFIPTNLMFLRYILLIPGLPAILISLVSEKFLFLKEPEEEKYIATEKGLKLAITQSAE